jgi:hypothetical protein
MKKKTETCWCLIISFIPTRCFAVSCLCGCSFCGWCLADCGRDAHQHVRQCASNANPGSYYGTPEQFERIQRERRRIAVQQYLASLPQEDAAKVRCVCSTGYFLYTIHKTRSVLYIIIVSSYYLSC